MKQLWRISMVFAVLACLAAPVAASTITGVAVVTSNYGYYQTGGGAAIGIADPGLGSYSVADFYNNLATDAIKPSTGIPSGIYLAFFGYEFVWPYAATAELTVRYSDDTTKTAVFQVGSLSAVGNWTRLSGDPLLTFGGGGVANPPDLLGVWNGHYISPDGRPDVVLQFSDTGGSPVVDAPAVPEPASLLLLGTGLLGGVRAWRKRRG